MTDIFRNICVVFGSKTLARKTISHRYYVLIILSSYDVMVAHFVVTKPKYNMDNVVLKYIEKIRPI